MGMILMGLMIDTSYEISETQCQWKDDGLLSGME